MTKMTLRTALGVLTLAAVAATVGVARGLDSRTEAKREVARCVPTADGKFMCKATGEIMDEPCCERPCCATTSHQ
jgi:hypothetical protein